ALEFPVQPSVHIKPGFRLDAAGQCLGRAMLSAVPFIDHFLQLGREVVHRASSCRPEAGQASQLTGYWKDGGSLFMPAEQLPGSGKWGQVTHGNHPTASENRVCLAVFVD